MKSISGARLALAILTLTLVACPNSNHETVTGKGSIRAINAAPDIGVVSFLIEEAPLGSLDFKEISGTTNFDNLQYEFNFDILLPGDVETTRLTTQSLQVRTDQEYTFVLAGTFASPELFLWEQFGRDWDIEIADAAAGDTVISVLEISFGHVAPNLGTVDAYLEAPGTSPEFATPYGTLGYGDFIPAAEIPAGTYQLILTEQENPSNILFASNPFLLSAAVSDLITIMDDGGTSTADVSIRLMGQGVGAEITSLDSHAEFRAVHAAFGTDEVDVFVGDDFTNAIAAGLPFGGTSVVAELDLGSTDFNITPAGNLGAFLEQRQITISQGALHTMFLVGLPGDMTSLVVTDDQRRLANFAKLRITQGAVRFALTDIYLLPAGSDIGLVSPNVTSLLFGQNSGYLSVSPNEYDLTFTLPGSKTVIGGPYRLQLEGSGIYSVVMVDSPDITTADIIQLDDFAQ